jgi:Ni/Co efflux regulator RcnB
VRSKALLSSVVALAFLLGTVCAFGQGNGHGNGHGNGNGNGHGNGHAKHGDDAQARYYYNDHDRYEVNEWYRERSGNGLPPGLAKRDQLPPGLEKQLRVKGTLPPGLRKKMYPCPEEVERRLPPPPPECEHRAIGGHVVLVNKSTYAVLDIIYLGR